jgi:hypothetical protein
VQKRKLLAVLAILIIIPLICLSAECRVSTEDKIDISEDEKSVDETSTGDDDKDTTGSRHETDEADSEDEVDEADSEVDDTYIEKEAPAITLKIYEGPIYSAADDVCYHRIEAEVTGTPSPSVTWSKDDSGGAWGPKIAQINLYSPSETYTLIATATNSEGSVTDSITLNWECEEPESEPESEPEEKDPGPPGLPWNSTTINASENMSGMLSQSGSVRHGTSPILIGDSEAGTVYKGYLSFNISDLHQRVVEYAEISFLNLEHTNHPESFASSLIVTVLDYGNSLDASDFAFGGDYLATIPISAPSYVISNDTLIEQLQKVLDDFSRNLFQLKLELNVTTNGDNVSDTVDIPSCSEEVWLSIDY